MDMLFQAYHHPEPRLSHRAQVTLAIVTATLILTALAALLVR